MQQSIEELIKRKIKVSVTIQMMHCDLNYELGLCNSLKESSDAIERYSRRITKFIRLLQWYTEEIEKIERDEWVKSASEEIGKLEQLMNR
jgi:hypothetical protein